MSFFSEQIDLINKFSMALVFFGQVFLPAIPDQFASSYNHAMGFIASMEEKMSNAERSRSNI